MGTLTPTPVILSQCRRSNRRTRGQRGRGGVMVKRNEEGRSGGNKKIVRVVFYVFFVGMFLTEWSRVLTYSRLGIVFPE